MQELEKKFLFPSPLGTLQAVFIQNLLKSLSLSNEPITNVDEIFTPFQILKEQIDQYFLGTLKTFSVPFILQGTAFQKKIYQELIHLEYGSTISYQELGQKSCYPKSARAVGSALKKNPLFLIVPCHRVILQSKKPGQFNQGSMVKVKLLDHEMRFS